MTKFPISNFRAAGASVLWRTINFQIKNFQIKKRPEAMTRGAFLFLKIFEFNHTIAKIFFSCNK